MNSLSAVLHEKQMEKVPVKIRTKNGEDAKIKDNLILIKNKK
ncbi:hypothetical protein [Sporanaerobium hydrogeniformans]|nr:hypothetical protein [Sporanaerobium hydrogeniformans]